VVRLSAALPLSRLRELIVTTGASYNGDLEQLDLRHIRLWLALATTHYAFPILHLNGKTPVPLGLLGGG
jgi:hypothetical protein